MTDGRNSGKIPVKLCRVRERKPLKEFVGSTPFLGTTTCGTANNIKGLRPAESKPGPRWEALPRIAADCSEALFRAPRMRRAIDPTESASAIFATQRNAACPASAPVADFARALAAMRASLMCADRGRCRCQPKTASRALTFLRPPASRLVHWYRCRPEATRTCLASTMRFAHFETMLWTLRPSKVPEFGAGTPKTL